MSTVSREVRNWLAWFVRKGDGHG